jgi:hypothetical protein
VLFFFLFFVFQSIQFKFCFYYRTLLSICRLGNKLLLLVAIATDVPWLVTQIASLGRFRTVSRQVTNFVAVEARLIGHAIHLSAFGTAARDMARLVAVVARRRIGILMAVFGKVALAIASVAAFGILLAFACKMAQPIALVAFLAAAAVVIATAVATTAASRLRALAGKVPRTAAFVTNAGTHLLDLYTNSFALYYLKRNTSSRKSHVNMRKYQCLR